MTPCRFVPPYLLERVPAMHPDDVVGGCCRRTLALDSEIRERRQLAGLAGARPTVAAPARAAFAVHSAASRSSSPALARVAAQYQSAGTGRVPSSSRARARRPWATW